MALFSFRHSVKTFSKKVVRQSRIAKQGQTLAHIRYITRDTAARAILLERLPEKDFSGTAARVEQAAEKSGGRVCERFTIALPIEADGAQREALVSAFAEHITKGEAGFIAAIHDKKENDLFNPHAHLICFDKQSKKGGRGRPSSVMGMARKNAIEKAAKDWAKIHNRMMSDWGYGAGSLIDHRSFVERGIDLVPTIHEGPGARKISATQSKVETKPEWQHIDSGHTRAEANNLIRQINKTKEKLNEQRANRLGGNNDANADRSKGCVPWLREGSVSNRGDGGPATRQRYSTEKDPRCSRTPFTLAGRRQSSSGGHSSAINSIYRPSLTKAKTSHQGAISRGVRRFRARRLRCTFRNLTFFNDTLQARLLRDEAPRRFLESAEDLTREPLKVKAPKQDTR